MTTIPKTDELKARLAATKTEVRVRYAFGGMVGIQDGDETREVPRNPDGPAALARIEELEAQVAALTRTSAASTPEADVERGSGCVWRDLKRPCQTVGCTICATDDLLKRLQAEEMRPSLGGPYMALRNPDGPEAAAAIAALTSKPTPLDPQGLIEDLLDEIDGWERAYPLRAFPEPDLEKAAAVLKANGMTLDSISASNMRHVVSCIAPKVRTALQSLSVSSQGLGNE